MLTMPREGRDRCEDVFRLVVRYRALPFLAIESDGSPFPQVITAKLETFCLRAERLHDSMLSTKNKHKVEELNAMLEGSGVTVLSLFDFPEVADVVE